jgi:hypothetical protein
MLYSYLADIVVGIHVAFVGYVIVGEFAILIGWPLRWQWVRDFWFRVSHLACIAIVAFETVCGFKCPLTVWEDHLRILAGQTVTQGAFIGRFLHNMMFFDGQPWVFNLCYLLFMALVAITFVLVPPFRRTSMPALKTADPQTAA